MQSLEELDIEDCPQMKSISIHHPRQEAECGSLACQAVLPTSLAQDEFLLHIPLNVLSTLEKFRIQRCPEMQLCSSSWDGFRGFTSLTELIITGCPMLFSSANETFSVPPSAHYLCIEFLPRRMQPYCPENRSSQIYVSAGEPRLAVSTAALLHSFAGAPDPELSTGGCIGGHAVSEFPPSLVN
jgi:hypothetical protein